jgi:hypothetical protein
VTAPFFCAAALNKDHGAADARGRAPTARPRVNVPRRAQYTTPISERQRPGLHALSEALEAVEDGPTAARALLVLCALLHDGRVLGVEALTLRPPRVECRVLVDGPPHRWGYERRRR